MYRDKERLEAAIFGDWHLIGSDNKIIKALGGMSQFIDALHSRQWIFNTLLFVRDNKAIDDSQFETFLEMCKNPDRHEELGLKLEPIRISTNAVRMARSQAQSPTHPHHVAETENIQRFIDGKPTGPGSLVEEYLRIEEGADVWSSQISRCKAYEFEWGFILETPTPCAQFEFFVADVWRSGTEKYFDRFLTAWKNDADPVVESLIANSAIMLTMDDGISNYDCLSLGCFSDAKTLSRTRQWLGSVFLNDIWPVMVARVLNPEYVFAAEWHNY